MLGTKGTVKREYTRRLIDDFAQGCDVTLVGSAELASLAESALSGNDVRDEDIAAELAPCFIGNDADRTDTVVLPNCDFDTGKPTKAAEYSLTDDTYAKLLARLSERKFDLTSPELRSNILDFYSDLSVPIETKTDQVRWRSVLLSLDQLRLVTPVPVAASSPAQ